MARGNIVVVDIPGTTGSAGHEQVGTRPALIVQDQGTTNSFSVIMIVPFSRNLNAQRYPLTIIVQPSALNGLHDPSVLLIFQLRAIDKTRITTTIGQLEPELMDQVDVELKKLLGLNK